MPAVTEVIFRTDGRTETDGNGWTDGRGSRNSYLDKDLSFLSNNLEQKPKFEIFE